MKFVGNLSCIIFTNKLPMVLVRYPPNLRADLAYFEKLQSSIQNLLTLYTCAKNLNFSLLH